MADESATDPTEITPGAGATHDLVEALRETGNLHPLIARLRGGDVGPESARDALLVLGRRDLELLVQISLNTLISEYVADPGLAHQPRRDKRT